MEEHTLSPQCKLVVLSVYNGGLLYSFIRGLPKHAGMKYSLGQRYVHRGK
jgi:hypothetical protein